MHSLLVLALPMVLFTVMLLAFMWAIVRNLRQGELFYRNLGDRLRGLRLSDALARFGVDTTAYLHAQRVIDIERHIQVCESCDVVERCDRQREAAEDLENFRFCPNHAELSALRSSH